MAVGGMEGGILLEYDYRADPIVGRVLSYWNEKRGIRAMPARRDIDPTELGRVLPHLQLIDVAQKAERFRYRLVGTSLVEAFGKEYTGKYLDELFSGERLRFATQIFRTVCQSRRPVFLRNRYSTTKNVEMIANRLYLPLSEDELTVNVIMGVLTFEYGRGALPGIWGIATLDATTTGIELIAAEV
jgi:hypothetical protein